MKDDELKVVITEAIAAALKADREEFWISQPQHYMDHQMMQQCQRERDEWRKNHDFIFAIRESVETGKKLGFKITITALITFILGAIVVVLKEWLRN